MNDAQRWVLPKKKGKRDFFGGGNDDDNDTETADITSCPTLCEVSFAAHAAYLLNGLVGNGCHSSLDSSRPWLVYWCLHGLDVLGRLSEVSDAQALACVRFLARCVAPDGGFGGGPGQQAHTAPTYAAVLSLAILSGHESCGGEAIALLKSARRGIYEFHKRCKVHHAGPRGAGAGGIRVSRDGEVDTRGAYTALSVAALLNTLTPELGVGVADWLVQCQTYEGGLGGEPGPEAHGGYAFCGLAAAVLLKSAHRLNLPLLLKWAASRQMDVEGGFQGRTNKLVDGCYSFWVGALFPLLHALLQAPNHTFSSPPPAGDSSTAAAAAASPSPTPADAAASSGSSPVTVDFGWLFDTLALQRYVLVACQVTVGGLRDKPGKHADLYHTCYCLSGLSLAQHATNMANSPVLGKEENLLVSERKRGDEVWAHATRDIADVLFPCHLSHLSLCSIPSSTSATSMSIASCRSSRTSRSERPHARHAAATGRTLLAGDTHTATTTIPNTCARASCRPLCQRAAACKGRRARVLGVGCWLDSHDASHQFEMVGGGRARVGAGETEREALARLDWDSDHTHL